MGFRKFAGRASALALIGALVVGSALVSGTPSEATGNTIKLYLSPPLVQGSDVSGAGTLLESFDSFSPGNCPTTVNTGSMTANFVGACTINVVSDVSGASTTSSTPTFGGSGSYSPGTGWYTYGSDPARTVTFGFSSPVKYVGFWWSGGSPNNFVEFLSGGAVLATFDSARIETVLGADAPASWPAGNGYVTSTDSTQYAKGYYFGNPRGFSANPPTGPSSITGGSRDAQYVYFNLYMPPSMSIDAVRFSGPGFEWDNLVTSTVDQTAPGSFVLADTIAVNSVVTFKPNATGVTGTTGPQASSSSATLTPNAFVRPGYTFAGWNTDSLGGGTPYTDGQSYDFTADLTLYAQWTADPASTFTVTFEPNGGSGTATTQTESGTVALDANPFTRDGFTFTGWNTQQDGLGEWFADLADFTFSADQTLWAQWTAVTPPTPDGPSIESLVNTGLSVLGPVGTTGLLIALGAPFFLVSDRFRRMRAFGSVVLHKSDHLTVTTPARFFDRLRRKK